jgi:hypothetical protein
VRRWRIGDDGNDGPAGVSGVWSSVDGNIDD